MGIFFQKKMTEKFSLKWNDFHSNVSRSFNLVRNEEYLHDVTLVSDDHNKLSAHKLVLSASSEYFRNIFKNISHSHPLLCLDGVSSEDLENIMDYIYNGEVQIYEEHLDRFLEVAQKLKLQGLNEKIVKNETEIKDFDSIEEVENKTEKEEITAEHIRPHVAANVGNMDVHFKDKSQKYKINEYLIENSDKSYECSICGKISYRNAKRTQKSRMQIHIETHLEGLTYTCSICQKDFRSSNALYKHKSQQHR